MDGKKTYKKRLIDERIELLLEVFGALVIEGPKWVGKTFTSMMHSHTSVSLSEESFQNLANANPKYIFTEDRPQLIDEWQMVPKVWDSVRNECDRSPRRGNFILTGSTKLSPKDRGKVFHSGAGRIERLKMYPMSLYESGESCGLISLSKLKEGKEFREGLLDDQNDLNDLALICTRGGWPESIEEKDKKKIGLLPNNYVNAICNDTFYQDEDYSPEILKQILISLARNESTTATKKTILADVAFDVDDDVVTKDLIASRTTLDKYLDYLKRIFVIDDVLAYSTNYKSTARLGKGAKRHLVDPSLAVSLLKLTPEKLMLNHKIFGNIFESLVLRDLRVYMEFLGGELYHFRDNLSGDEVDAIIEFDDGDYAAIEIKLTQNLIEEGKKSLLKFYDNVKEKPKFMCVICGDCNYAIKDEKTGIIILPVTALKP